MKKLVGNRRTNESAITTSSMSVAVQALDAEGKESGSEIALGTVTPSISDGVVSFRPATGATQTAAGYQLIVREQGDDARISVVKLFLEDVDEEPDPDPEPVPDTTDPSVPTNLAQSDVTTTGFKVSWSASTDNVAVTGYTVYLDGAVHKVGATSPVTFTGRPSSTAHTVGVVAYDEAGNTSEPATLVVTTATPEPEPPTSGTLARSWFETNSGFKGNPASLTPTRHRQLRTNGQVIQNERINCSDGELGIYADNVTIKNCIIEAGIWGIFLYNGADNLVVENCTFIGGYQAGAGLSQAKNWRFTKCEFHSGRDALKPGGSGVVEDCFFHSPATGGDAHNDCLQFSHTDGVTVRHNYMEGADTSCIAMFEGQATFKNVTIDNNFMTGAGYLIYAGGNSGTGIKVKNNIFGQSGWGPVTWYKASNAGNEWVNNKDTQGRTVNGQY